MTVPSPVILAFELEAFNEKEYSNETNEEATLSIKFESVLLFAAEGNPQVRIAKNMIMVFLMITVMIAEVVP